MTTPTTSAHSPLAAVRALVFDVFGTVVDWRSGVIAEVRKLASAKGVAIDAPAFADAWRAGYVPAMNRVRSGEQPWANIDTLHRQILDGLLVKFGIEGLAEHEIEHLNKVWHRLHGWPDSVDGLTRLKHRHVVSTLSNGNVALLTNMGKHAGLPWDCVLSAETMGHYKPDLVVYETAAKLLGWKPSEVMMVAAHPGDLRAAQRVGLRTAYVRRPLEHGAENAAAKAAASPIGLPPGTEPDHFDLVVDSLTELADRLDEAAHPSHTNDPLGSPFGPAPYGNP